MSCVCVLDSITVSCQGVRCESVRHTAIFFGKLLRRALRLVVISRRSRPPYIRWFTSSACSASVVKCCYVKRTRSPVTLTDSNWNHCQVERSRAGCWHRASIQQKRAAQSPWAELSHFTAFRAYCWRVSQVTLVHSVGPVPAQLSARGETNDVSRDVQCLNVFIVIIYSYYNNNNHHHLVYISSQFSLALCCFSLSRSCTRTLIRTSSSILLLFIYSH